MELKIEKKCEIDIARVVYDLYDYYLESGNILETMCGFIEDQLCDAQGDPIANINDFPDEQTCELKTEILHQFANKLSNYKFIK